MVKLFDEFKFVDEENQKYHALILEYMPGGDLAGFFERKLSNGIFLFSIFDLFLLKKLINGKRQTLFDSPRNSSWLSVFEF